MQYILKTLLADAFGLDVLQTFNLEEFINSPHPKINYSDSIVENTLTIKPHSILFDVGIKDYPIEVIQHVNFYKLFFKNSNVSFPFDVFGASFWLLTRYEEYLPFKVDTLNRFNYKSSLAYQYDFIEQPLINIWLNELKVQLKENFVSIKFKERTYNFISTLDIDNVYKYKHKGLVRSVAGFLKDSIKRNFIAVKLRYQVMLSKKNDSYDCYDFLINAHKKQNVVSIFFFLLGDYGPNDKNHSATNLAFQALIKKIADYSLVGIHPSYGSNTKIQQLKVEVSRLANIIHSTINFSRQHYSILKFPETYQNLLQAGIEQDFSMGYTNYNGFRASYCFPFKWYDLKNEILTPLIINSFCITENTIVFNSSKTNKSFFETISPIIDNVKRYNGQLISIFHNDTFDEDMKKNYVRFLEMVKKV